MKRHLSVMVLAGILAACGDGFIADDEPLASGEAALSSSVRIMSEVGCMQTVTDVVTGKDTFHGYPFETKAPAKINLKTWTGKRARLMVYGPQKANGSWGSAFFKEWVEWSTVHGGYTVSVPVTLPAAGRYLVTLGSYTPGKLTYDLNFTCLSQPHCVEYVTTDDLGNSLRNFYAFDVDSLEAGEQHLAQLGGLYTDAAINPGTCAQQRTSCLPACVEATPPCSIVMPPPAPVCGDVATDDLGPATYDRVCFFKVAIRQAASGSEWKGSKGHWDEGPCGGFCVSWRAAGVDGNPIDELYTDNVSTYEEAQQLLLGMAPVFEERIDAGHCSEQPMDCYRTWLPVCGDITVDAEPARTFGNACTFRHAVMLAAGNEDRKAHGQYVPGECPQSCPVDEEPYINWDPETCQLIKYGCSADQVPFSNDCGCGCKPAQP